MNVGGGGEVKGKGREGKGKGGSERGETRGTRGTRGTGRDRKEEMHPSGAAPISHY